NPTADAWWRSMRVPAFVAHNAFERCLRRDDNVLAFPFGPKGDSMLWQAEADFGFRLAGAYVGPSPPPSFTHPPGVADIALYGEGRPAVTSRAAGLRAPAPSPAPVRRPPPRPPRPRRRSARSGSPRRRTRVPRAPRRAPLRTARRRRSRPPSAAPPRRQRQRP